MKKIKVLLVFIIASILLCGCDITIEQERYNFNNIIISIISLFIATVSIVISIVSIFVSRRNNTSQLIRNVIMELYTDDIWKTYKLFEEQDEYKDNHKWYYLGFYSESNKFNVESKTIDNLFGHMNYICYLLNNKFFTIKEKPLCLYYVNRVLENNSSKNYLYNLYHYTNARLKNSSKDNPFDGYCISEKKISSIKHTNTVFPYFYLLKYALKKEFIKEKEFICYPPTKIEIYGKVIEPHLQNKKEGNKNEE